MVLSSVVTVDHESVSTSEELAEVLFCSDLQPSDQADPDQIRAAVLRCLTSYGSASACLCQLAADYGEDPETTIARMRWCRDQVELAYAA